MKNYKTFIAFISILFISLNANSQLLDHPRGMYVDRFFSFSGDKEPGFHTAADIDRNITLLGDEVKENELLQYAKDHHITYLLLYDVHKFIYDLDMLYNGSTVGQLFCNFISKAKNQYCIQKVGVAGSTRGFFDDFKANIETVPLQLTQQELTLLNGNPLIHVQDNTFPTIKDRRLAEFLKVYLKIASFNRSNAARFGVNGGGINCSGSTIDVLTTEIEFWNLNEGSLPDNWLNYEDVMDGIDGIKAITSDLYTETYLGILENVDPANYSGTNPTLPNTQDVAEFIDGEYTTNVRRVDRIITHYYFNAGRPEIMDVYNLPVSANWWKQIYHDKRFMEFLNPVYNTVDRTVIQPSFSVENSFYNHNNAETFLGSWFSNSTHNNIWTYEKEFYDDWIRDRGTGVHGLASSNDVAPGAATWFSSPFLMVQKQFQNPFASNSPICAGNTVDFQYQGPIEDGLSYHFFILNSNGSIEFSEVKNWPPYEPIYIGPTDIYDYPIHLPTGISLAPGQYTAHLILNYTSDCSKEFIQPVIVSPTVQMIQSANSVCGRTLFSYPAGAGESVVFTTTNIPGATYQWSVGATVQSSVTNVMSYLPAKNISGTDRIDQITCTISGTSSCLSTSPQQLQSTVVVHPNYDSQISVSCASGGDIVLGVVNPGPSTTSYLWSDGSTQPTLTPSFPGLYSVIITQAVGGCTASMKRRTTIVNLETPIINPGTVGFCTRAAVPVDFTLANLQDGVNYEWFLSSPTGTPQKKGPVYTMTPSDGNVIFVKATYGSCSYTSSITVDFSKLTLAFSSSNVRCNGESSGSIDVEASNGSTSTYEYSIGIGPWLTTSSWPSLVADTYKVRASNAGSLSDIQTITISQPTALTANLSTTVPIKCNGDIATLNPGVNGGTQPYYFEWSDGDDLPEIKRGALQSTDPYSVIITDGHSCSVTSNQITLSEPPALSVSFIHSDITTCGGADGFACFDVANGTQPYTYSWSCSSLNTNCINNLPAISSCSGTVIDAAGCEVTKNFSIENLQSLEVNTSTTLESCGNASGSATANVFGGNTYTYSWWPSGGTNKTAVGLSLGNYVVSVTADNGCTGTATATVLSGTCCTGGTPTPAGIYPILSGTYDLRQSIVLSQDLAIDGCHLTISEGLSITVPDGFTLEIRNNSHLEGCSNMWKGIIVEYGGTLNIENSTIEDAENGAFVNDGGSFKSIDGTVFNDNYIGVATATNPLDRMNEYPTFIVEKTSFTGSGTLKGKYPAQGTDPGNYPYAGLLIYSSTVAIGGSSGNNTFDHLNSGIISRYSNIDILSSDFKNIQKDPSYSFSTFGGSGIDARSTRGRFTLTQHGNGTSINSFENCNYGIYTHRMNTDISSNKMVSVGTGVRIEDCYFGEISVLNNKIDCNEFGIDLRLNDGCQKMWVKYNQIDVGSSQAPTALMAGVGINVMEVGIGGLDRDISNNNPINVNTYGISGIREIAVTNMNTSGNHINLNNVAANLSGIDNQGSKDNTMYCNQIAGSSATYIGPQQSGYFICMSDNLEMQCNISDKLFNGFYFSGPCTNTNFSGNEINAHQYGLYLDAAAIIGEQDYKGNVWLSSYGLKGAYNQNAINNGTGVLVAFRVDPNDGANGLPPSFEPSDWFAPFPNGGVTYSCATNNTCGIYPLQSPNDITEMDLTIARDEISTSQYEFETKWKLKQDLYNKLRENPSLIYSNPDLIAFYNQLFNTVITDLETVNQLKKSLFSVNSTLKNTLNQNAFTIKSNLESIKTLQSQLVADGLTDTQRNQIKSSILNLQSNIKTLDITNRQIYSDLESQKYTNADFLKDLNDRILTPKTIEVNERDVNAIYANAIVKNNSQFTETEISRLFAIASQCVISGGPAVFKARSLYSMIDNNIRFSDKDICFSQGIMLRHRNTSEENPNMIIFPNPSTGKFTVRYDLENKSDVYLSIFDELQREVKFYKLDGNASQMEIDLSEFDNGMYIYKIKSSDNSIHAQGRLSLIK